MKEKKLTTVIAFATTTQAMAMERKAKEQSFEGRIIPVPREITASCGLAWKCREQTPHEAEEFVTGNRLDREGIYQVLL